MSGICRIDHEASRTHCWRVTVQRRKRIYLRHFSDRQHGGKQQALQAAQSYRDTLIQTHPPFSKPAYCAIRKKNNRSGVSGVTRVDTWDLSKGRRVRRLFWEAQWPIGSGKARHKKFSVTKYGERGAYLRALAARRAALRTLTSQTFPSFDVPIWSYDFVADRTQDGRPFRILNILDEYTRECLVSVVVKNPKNARAVLE